jgi:CRISPR system Cascade subunit CasA
LLNLITDAWIPVRRLDGSRDVIRPDQIAEADVDFPDWPRADLNLACLELLIGLVYLADPPQDPRDWRERKADPGRLRAALEPLAPAFNLLGEGPRFLQDFDTLVGSDNPTDMLFIDSAGGQTIRYNKDLMVKRDRYGGLSPAMAAMALYTLQAFAPSGGAGNRTSMRGGGPMVTLVQPRRAGLWSMIWANVPEGEALPPDTLSELPWMRPTQTSENKQMRLPPAGGGIHPEAFFGMPRRLRLTAVNLEDDTSDPLIIGVTQTPWGTNYGQWVHPLSPYYHMKNEVLPKHPKPGQFGYRNWAGIVLQSETGDRALVVERFLTERKGEAFDLLVGGWAMSNMSPLDFLWSQAPVYPLGDAGETQAAQLVSAAEQIGYVLALNVKEGQGETDLSTGAGARVRDQFFARTQAGFEQALDHISTGQGEGIAQHWLATCRSVALDLFDREVLPGLADLSETRRQNAVAARRSLSTALNGYGGFGKKIFTALDLELPVRSKKPTSAKKKESTS